ncbi:TadE/TadG family type IV pilus assembly protein [Embleya sp. NBC_00896]|uniref:TadE/TadG family type IV pilus assembly protein n=1 Tax=Embleya sp. NBC_00896 TaxID=2975961 RepID=UPI002F915596|nr:pilus assembly protein [Embleya sp. NBC_00896]
MPSTRARRALEHAHRRIAHVKERPDAGSVTAELTILLPLLILVLLLVVAAGRLAGNRIEVKDAAHQAARAASLARDPVTARSRAESTARSALDSAGLSCRDLGVSVDVSAFAPGGVARVTVRCTVDLSDVTASGMPGSRTLAATATSAVDTHRGTTGSSR